MLKGRSPELESTGPFATVLAWGLIASEGDYFAFGSQPRSPHEGNQVRATLGIQESARAAP